MSWRRRLLPFLSKLPYRAISCIHHTLLPDPRQQCCINATPPPPHSLAASPPAFWLISTRLPLVTAPTLKSYQSLLLQGPRHQQDSFCLNGTKKSGRAFVMGLTPHTNLADGKKVTVNLFSSSATSSCTDPRRLRGGYFTTWRIWQGLPDNTTQYITDGWCVWRQIFKKRAGVMDNETAMIYETVLFSQTVCLQHGRATSWVSSMRIL